MRGWPCGSGMLRSGCTFSPVAAAARFESSSSCVKRSRSPLLGSGGGGVCVRDEISLTRPTNMHLNQKAILYKCVRG